LAPLAILFIAHVWCRFVLTQPTGSCKLGDIDGEGENDAGEGGDAEVACNSGCARIPTNRINSAAGGEPTLLFLDGTARTAGNCSDLTRAFNAAQVRLFVRMKACPCHECCTCGAAPASQPQW
jgi:hypothetical protein